MAVLGAVVGAVQGDSSLHSIMVPSTEPALELGGLLLGLGFPTWVAGPAVLAALRRLCELAWVDLSRVLSF